MNEVKESIETFNAASIIDLIHLAASSELLAPNCKVWPFFISMKKATKKNY